MGLFSVRVHVCTLTRTPWIAVNRPKTNSLEGNWEWESVLVRFSVIKVLGVYRRREFGRRFFGLEMGDSGWVTTEISLFGVPPVLVSYGDPI